MDAANLTFAQLVLSLFGSLAFAGIGVAVGYRLLPLSNLHRKIKTRNDNTENAEPFPRVPCRGKLLPTEIIGLEGNLIRYRDGSYGKAYKFEPANTLYDDGNLTEQRIEELKTILKFDRPQNTIIQFRFENAADDGSVLKEHLRSRNKDGSDPVACLLQAGKLSLYEESIRSGQIMQQTASVWIRVPVRASTDKSILSRVVPSIARELNANGAIKFLSQPVIRLKNSTRGLFVIRQEREESRCREKAKRVFQSFESNFPRQLNLCEMDSVELFASLFKSHRRDTANVPVLPENKRIDIRRYLAAANIEANDDESLVRHNGTPASLVSLKTLPNGFVTADVMRYLTATRSLCFPHEIVVDIMTTEKRSAKKDLQKRIDRIERSRNTWLGFRNLKKDAVVIKNDLEDLLEQVEADNEEICTFRMNVIVFADRSIGTKDRRRQIEALNDRCDSVISAIRRKIGADAVREEPVRQRAIYPRMLAGELSARRTGQEQTETADSIIAFIPTEINWRGNSRPHSIFTTPNGQMFGLNLYDRSLIKSPTVIVTAASGEGKSFLASMLITDIRAHRGNVKVRVMDYRYSFKPICKLLGGRHIEFTETDPKPINIWNYPGIDKGRPPSKRQLAMVLTDILILSKTPKADAITSAIAATVIDEVYKIDRKSVV